MTSLAHTPQPGSGERYMFMQNIPTLVKERPDVKFYIEQVRKNPETWDIELSPREHAAEYASEFLKKVKKTSIEELKPEQVKQLAKDLEVDSTGKPSELLTLIKKLEE
jgi:galactokinase